MLFFILLCWVFEVQILMQIIINRIAIICETQNMVQKLKWGTAIVMTTINIAVFCIVSAYNSSTSNPVSLS